MIEENSKILLESTTSRDSIKKLYHWHKTQRRNFTLQNILNQTGVPSKGYLSTVLNGKKTLGRKHLEKFCKLFKLNRKQKAYLDLQVRLDLSRSEKNKEKVREELQKQAEILGVGIKTIPKALANHLFFSEVFCSFALWENDSPTISELIEHFGIEKSLEVQEVLLELERMKIINWDRDSGTVTYIERHLVLIKDDNPEIKRQYILKLLEDHYMDGIGRMGSYFGLSDRALFNAFILSTTKEKLAKNLPAIREKLLELRELLSADDADQLVRFNVQIYPVE